jgi:hypothetical protein
MAEKNPKVPENKPRKKNKWLIAGGVITLVAVVVVIGVFAQRGEWFRGSIQQVQDVDVPDALQHAADYDFTQEDSVKTFYVDDNSPACGQNEIKGTKSCPFKQIRNAFEAMSEYDKAKILVAEGTYQYDSNFSGKEIEMIGGYDAEFASNNGLTEYTGTMILRNVKGKITNITFNLPNEETYALKINNSGFGTNEMTLEDNIFKGGVATQHFVDVENVIVKNNKFSNAKSNNSVLIAKGSSLVESNHFLNSVSGSTDNGIIKAVDNVHVFNNLIINSLSGNKVCLKTDGNARISNNTFADNRASNAVLSIEGTPNLVNNLVAYNQGAPIRIPGDPPIFTNNAFWGNTGEYTVDNYNWSCNPFFPATHERTNNPDSYKLGGESPCINLGKKDKLVTSDFFGTSRPQGDGYDIGFHEVFEMYIAPFEPLDVTPLYPEDEEEEPPADEEDPPADEADDEEEPADEADDEEEPADDEEEPADDEEEPADEEEAVACGEWWDVSEDDNDFDTWMYLCEREIVRGNDDGSLRPDDNLNRAELLAIAFRASDSENIMDVDFGEDNCFPDVGEQWFAPYICTAKDEGFVEGYPDGTAKPARDVIMAEGAKMLMGALDLPFNTGSGEDWYVPILNAADENNYLPYRFNRPSDIAGMELTRRDTFDMVYRMLYSL